MFALSSQSALTFYEGIVEPDNDYFNKKGLMALPGTCHSERNLGLALLNMSDEPITLTAGDLVGTIHCAHHIADMLPLKPPSTPYPHSS